MEKLKSEHKIDIKQMERDIIKQISPGIEERIKFEVVKTITDALEEQTYPPEEMIKKEFIKEVEEASKRAGEGKVKSFKNPKELNAFLENLKDE